jgi:methanogenic corrinoid protein MtbC1
MNAPDKYPQLIHNLLELEEEAVLSLVKERLQAGDDPIALIVAAQEAMREVGKRYEQRQYYISGMMMAGEIFREVMELVQPVLEQRLVGSESGHILLGTVQGDIHDIGKSIFVTMLRCHGFTVTDLGVDVAPSCFAQETLSLRPDIIGLSGLLTISYDTMKSAVQEIRWLEDTQVSHTPVIIGGGTINAMVCAYVGADFWATDAMFGVQLCRQIMADKAQKPDG